MRWCERVVCGVDELANMEAEQAAGHAAVIEVVYRLQTEVQE